MMRIGATGKRTIGRSVARDPKEKGKEKERRARDAALSHLPDSNLDSEEKEKVPEASHQDEVLGSLGLRPADAPITDSLLQSKDRCTRTS